MIVGVRTAQLKSPFTVNSRVTVRHSFETLNSFGEFPMVFHGESC